MEKEPKAFRKLIVWQRAHDLTLMIYKASEKFPRNEMFGLTSQMRRSVVSVEANIAEGYVLGTGRLLKRRAISKSLTIWGIYQTKLMKN